MKEITKNDAMRIFKKKNTDTFNRDVLEERWELFTKELFDKNVITRYQYGTWKSPFNK